MSDILFEVNDGIATITLNRPEKLNAMNRGMTKLLREYVDTCNSNNEVRVVILTSEGERAFCAGSDIKDLDSYETP